jgi:hypothetical protein
MSTPNVDAGPSFAVWPPLTVREVNPFDFGVHTGADQPRGRRLNSYVKRDIDPDLELALKDERVVVVSAPQGAGATRTVYEALKHVHLRARLLIPMRPGEFASEDLFAANFDADTVLWLDKLGSHWGVEGSQLFGVLAQWLSKPRRWMVATAYDDGPDVLTSKEFERLNARVLRLDKDLTRAELDRMLRLYGSVQTTTSIGFHPPVKRPPTKPEPEPTLHPTPEPETTPYPVPETVAREHVPLLDDEPVGLADDQLGREGVADALRDQLQELAENFRGKSFFVHLDGAWGAGKSSLLRFLRESVDTSWLVVPYDAWRQSRGGPPWLTLLQAVRAGVRSTHAHAAGRALFWLRERFRLIRTWQWLALLLMFLIVAAAVLLVVKAHLNLTLSKWGDLAKLVGVWFRWSVHSG